MGVHLQDNTPDIVNNKEFWHIMGFLQLLYYFNSLPAPSALVSASSSPSSHHPATGSRVELSKFTLRGIDKCDALIEHERWAESYANVVEPPARTVTTSDTFTVTTEFASLLSHSNLVPISFRQRCLKQDVLVGAM